MSLLLWSSSSSSSLSPSSIRCQHITQIKSFSLSQIAFIMHTASHLFFIMVRSTAQWFSLYHETWSPMSLLQCVPLTFLLDHMVHVVVMYWGYLLVMCHLTVFFYCFVFTNCIYREDITWPRGDTKFLFKC